MSNSIIVEAVFWSNISTIKKLVNNIKNDE
jgi:hypothetical protein